MQPVTSQPPSFASITLVAHADWSMHPAKRWLALATRRDDHSWLLSQLTRVDRPSDLWHTLKSQCVEYGCILVGFDFPIGLPAAYAAKAGLDDFLSALTIFGRSDWANFYTPADDPSQIRLQRPFYPARAGGSKRRFLEDGLGIPFIDLYRLCEKAHLNRRPACPLFWTMGGQQVGKAAISAWQSLLAPSLLNPIFDFKIWPFSGTLHKLCLPGNIVALETYPAEFYHHLGLSFGLPVRRSKRRQADRSFFGPQLISWAQEHSLVLPPSLIQGILDGFGSGQDGEDRFDALVGLYGMINVIQGNRAFVEPRSSAVSKVEGWIFGQDQPAEGN